MDLSPFFPIAYFLAGFIASGINAIAGGGSLLSFPLLIGTGLPDLPANATNSVALWPGSMSGAIGYRDHFAKTKNYLRLLLLPTCLGSAAGSLVLLNTPEKVFRIAVPVLILLATTLLAFQPRIKAWSTKHEKNLSPAQGAFFQALVSFYGGYFGAGMGILMLAYMGLLIDEDIHAINALKGWLGLAINATASVFFIWKGAVVWPVLGWMVLGTILGGYVAAKWSLGIDPDTLRKAIVVIGFVLSVVFTIRVLG